MLRLVDMALRLTRVALRLTRMTHKQARRLACRVRRLADVIRLTGRGLSPIGRTMKHGYNACSTDWVAMKPAEINLPRLAGKAPRGPDLLERHGVMRYDPQTGKVSPKAAYEGHVTDCKGLNIYEGRRLTDSVRKSG